MYLTTGLMLKMVLEQILLDSSSLILENSSRTSHLTLGSLIAAKPTELSCVYFGFRPLILPLKVLAFRPLLWDSSISCSPHTLLHAAHTSSSSYRSREWKSISVPVRQVISLMADIRKALRLMWLPPKQQEAQSSSKDLCFIPCLKTKQRELLFNSPLLSLWA